MWARGFVSDFYSIQYNERSLILLKQNFNTIYILCYLTKFFIIIIIA